MRVKCLAQAHITRNITFFGPVQFFDPGTFCTPNKNSTTVPQCLSLDRTKKIKKGIRSLFDHSKNPIAADTILSVTYGGPVIELLDCFGKARANYFCYDFTA